MTISKDYIRWIALFCISIACLGYKLMNARSRFKANDSVFLYPSPLTVVAVGIVLILVHLAGGRLIDRYSKPQVWILVSLVLQAILYGILHFVDHEQTLTRLSQHSTGHIVIHLLILCLDVIPLGLVKLVSRDWPQTMAGTVMGLLAFSQALGVSFSRMMQNDEFKISKNSFQLKCAIIGLVSIVPWIAFLFYCRKTSVNVKSNNKESQSKVTYSDVFSKWTFWSLVLVYAMTKMLSHEIFFISFVHLTGRHLGQVDFTEIVAILNTVLPGLAALLAGVWFDKTPRRYRSILISVWILCAGIFSLVSKIIYFPSFQAALLESLENPNAIILSILAKSFLNGIETVLKGAFLMYYVPYHLIGFAFGVMMITGSVLGGIGGLACKVGETDSSAVIVMCILAWCASLAFCGLDVRSIKQGNREDEDAETSGNSEKA